MSGWLLYYSYNYYSLVSRPYPHPPLSGLDTSRGTSFATSLSHYGACLTPSLEHAGAGLEQHVAQHGDQDDEGHRQQGQPRKR